SPAMSRKGSAGCKTPTSTRSTFLAANSALTSPATEGERELIDSLRSPPRSLPGPVGSLRVEDLLHLGYQTGFRHGDLRGPRGAPFGIVGNFGRHARAFDQVLDLDLALFALVAALNDGHRAAAPVGIFELRLHARAAEIHLGADAGL